MNCAYVKTADGKLWKCQRLSCGHETLVRPHHTVPPKRVNCSATVSVETCPHRLSQLGEIPCESCNGSVRIKLFTCELYQKCTVGKKIAGVACCAACLENPYAPSRVNKP